MHVAGKRQPAHHRSCADGIDDVVHVKAIARTLLPANARQGSIEAVAEPIHRETNDGRKQQAAVPSSEGIADARSNLGGKPDHGQMVGIDPSWHAFGYPEENPLFGSGQQTSVDASRLLEPGATGFCQSLGVDFFRKVCQRRNHNFLRTGDTMRRKREDDNAARVKRGSTDKSIFFKYLNRDLVCKRSLILRTSGSDALQHSRPQLLHRPRNLFGRNHCRRRNQQVIARNSVHTSLHGIDQQSTPETRLSH